MTKTIITAAINGPTIHRGICPTVPFTPREIADEAERAWSAGASVVHVTAREDGGSPSYRVERHREVVLAVRERCPVILSMSTAAFGVSLEDRRAPIEARPDLALLPVGTLTWARYNAAQKAFDYDHAFANPFSDVIALARAAREHGVRTVAACYDLGHLESVRTLVDMGALEAPVLRALVLGLTGGIAATTHNLCRMAENLEGHWSLAAAEPSWPLLGATLALGGDVRVGFEDGTALPGGDTADSNGALVEAAVRVVEAVGGTVASVDDARVFLGAAT